MAELHCPNCGAEYTLAEQRQTADHWLKIGSCPNCREGVLERPRKTFSLTQMLLLSTALIVTLTTALALQSYHVAEWNYSTVLCYSFAFTIAIYLPIYYIFRSFFAGS